jgi:hypothetical protein
MKDLHAAVLQEAVPSPGSSTPPLMERTALCFALPGIMSVLALVDDKDPASATSTAAAQARGSAGSATKY